MGKNQSKIGSFSLRLKSNASEGNTKTDMQYGSLESLSTSISLNSRVALLKSSNSLDEIHPGEETPRETGALDDRGRYRLLDESVDFTSSDELCRLQSSPQPCDPPSKAEEGRSDQDSPDATQDHLSLLQGIPQMGADQVEDLQRIPVLRSLNKLTPTEVDYLVQFICSSVEDSLQSVILQRLHELRSYQRTLDSSSTGSSYNDEQEHVVVTRKSSHRSHHHHHHHQDNVAKTSSRRRPVSMPPTEISPWEIDGAEHQEGMEESNQPVETRGAHSRGKHRHHHRSKRTSNSPPVDKSIDDNCPGLYHNRIRSSSSPNRVHWLKPDCVTQTHQYQGYAEPTTSQGAATQPESGSPPLDSSFLTLGQLKDLGLALRQEPPLHEKENTSAISMQCCLGTSVNGYRRAVRPKKRKVSGRRNSHRSSRTKENKTQQLEEMEPLGYFGPDLPDSGRDSPATNMAVADMEVRSPSPLEDETGYEVRHLHQHCHHHFHHVIHHSFSQTMDNESMLAPAAIEEISIGTQ